MQCTLNYLSINFTGNNLLFSQQYGFRPIGPAELAALEVMNRDINHMNKIIDNVTHQHNYDNTYMYIRINMYLFIE